MKDVERDMEGLRGLLREALPPRRGQGFIIGPSHAARWRHVLETDLLPAPFSRTVSLGEGGFPVWNRTVFAQLFARHEVGQPIFLIVPDFRFGNSIASGPFVSGQFYANHTHIRKEAILPRVDAIMYRHQVDCLAIWRSVFGRDLMIFDWTMLMNASTHHLQERYVDQDGYQNQAYAAWVHSDRPRLGALSWSSALLERENHRLQRLIVDRSQHPSLSGFMVQHGMMTGSDFGTALTRAEGIWAAWCAALVAAVAARTGPAVALSGRSIWFETTLRQMTAETLDALAQAGVILPGRAVPPDAVHVEVSDEARPGFGDGSAAAPHVIAWGSFARTIVSCRHPATAHLAVSDLDAIRLRDPLDWLGQTLDAPRVKGLLDAGADFAPTHEGIAHLLLSVRAVVAARAGRTG